MTVDRPRTALNVGGMMVAVAAGSVGVSLLGYLVPLPDTVVVLLSMLVGGGVVLLAVALGWLPVLYREDASGLARSQRKLLRS